MPGAPECAAAGRVVVAVALAVAAAVKLADRGAVAAATVALLDAPGRFVAAVLPGAEAVLAVALLAWWSPVPGLLAALALGVFTAVLVRAARRGVPCPCFGVGAAPAPPGVRSVVRNGVLFAGAVLATGSPVGADPVVAAVLTVALGGAVVVSSRPRQMRRS